jgi:hypothetical protein
MSLAIDIDRVKKVLLPDGIWHDVADASFELDSYEYICGSEDFSSYSRLRHGGGTDKLICATGAMWREHGVEEVFYCPLTSIRGIVA